MTALARNFPYLGVEEYLRLERSSTSRHEFVDGVVYAMAGASRRHTDISRDVCRAIEDRVSAPCRPYALDVQVHIKTAEKERLYYPDVLVTSSELDNDEYLVRLPTLIVEALSKSTEDVDCKDKSDDYRSLSSLQEYVLVDQERQCVEIHRRRTNWEQETCEADADITLESVSITVPVAAFYKRVRF